MRCGRLWVVGVALLGWLACDGGAGDPPDDEGDGGAGALPDDGDAGGAAPGDGGAGGAGAGGFVSDDPAVLGGAREGGGGADGGAIGAGGEGVVTYVDPGMPPPLAEAPDRVRVEGDRLYVASSRRGLEVVGPGPGAGVLGRFEAHGHVVELAVREGRASVVLGVDWQYEWRPESAGLYRGTTRVWSLDVSDPTAIVETGHLDLAGDAVAARIEGDRLLLVADEPCDDGCGGAPWLRTVTAVDLGPLAETGRVALPLPSKPVAWGAIGRDHVYLFVPGDDRFEVQAIAVGADGTLRAGPPLELRGRPCAMNEHDGALAVLRTEPRPGGAAIVIATYAAAPDGDLVALGEQETPGDCDPDLVRAGGPFALLLGRQRRPPRLIDRRDPASPRVFESMEAIPGQGAYAFDGETLIVVAPRGDDPHGPAAVSLYDLADPAAPRLVGAASLPEDQALAWAHLADPIHAPGSFDARWLPEARLVVVPTRLYEEACDDDGPLEPLSLQLVQVAEEPRLLGAIGHRGRLDGVRWRDGRTFAVGPDRVSMGAPGEPTPPPVVRGRTVLAAAPLGEAHVVRVALDPATGIPRLETVRRDALDAPTGTLSMAAEEVFGEFPASCPRPRPVQRFVFENSVRLLAGEDDVWMLWNKRTSRAARLAVFDLRDPSAPALVAQHDLPFEAVLYRDYVWSGIHRPWTGSPTVETGRAMGRVGDTLVAVGDGRFELLDLSDPLRPRHTSVEVPGAARLGRLLFDRSIAATSYAEPVPGEPGRVRFQLARLDLSDVSAPRLLPPVNIPGSLVAFDAARGRLVTVDYHRHSRDDIPAERCDESLDTYDRRCAAITYSINLLELRDDVAVRLAEAPVDGPHVIDVTVTETHVAVGLVGDATGTIGRRIGWYTSPRPRDPSATLVVLDGVARGALEERARIRLPDPSARLLTARGQTAFVGGGLPEAVRTYDLAGATAVGATLLGGPLVDSLWLGDSLHVVARTGGAMVVPAPAP